MNPQIVTEQSQHFHQEKCSWEAAINQYAGPDPLDIWFNYVCWYEQNVINDVSNQFRETLERCLSHFENNEAYKQDLRMIRLWMKYIDMQPNPLHLYQILYQRGIGTQCASFYIGWAHYYDSADAFKQAESVYNLGFQAKAQPMEEIQAAHTKFRLSIAQRMLYDDTPSKKRAASTLAEQRQSIIALRPALKKPRMDGSENGNEDYNNGPEMHQQSEAHNNNLKQSYHSSSQNIYTDSTQCNLNNSAYVISSSLNYVYDDTNTSNYSFNSIDEQQMNLEFEGIKLPPNFVRYAKNSHDTWKAPLCLEEPYDPDRRCIYPKHLVYPDDGKEYSLEEIRAKKWQIKLDHIKEKQRLEVEQEKMRLQREEDEARLRQQQQQYRQQREEAERLLQQQEEQMRLLEQQYENQMQQSSNRMYSVQTASIPQHSIPAIPRTEEENFPIQETPIYKTNHMNGIAGTAHYSEPPEKVNQVKEIEVIPTEKRKHKKPKRYDDGELNDFEEQIEASTIRFCSNYGVNKSKTITIKFKKEKPSVETTPKVPSSAKSKKKSSRNSVAAVATPVRNFDDTTTFVPSGSNSSCDSTTATKYNSQDNHRSTKTTASTSAATANNQQYDQQYHLSRNHIEDANLLLSIANMHSSSTNNTDATNEDSAYSTAYASPAVNNQEPGQQFLNNDDSYSNSDYNTSFNSCSGENSNSAFTYSENSTPLRTNNHPYIPDLIPKSSTPHTFKFLKKHTSNISNQNDDSMCSTTENSFFAAEADDDIKQRRVEKAIATIESHLSKPIVDPFSNDLCKSFLTKIGFPSRAMCEVYRMIHTPIPKLSNTKSTMFADIVYNLEKEVGRGAYGAVYKAVNSYSGAVVAVKYQKPANAWELYICNEVKRRISNHDMLPGFMDVIAAVMAPNGCVLVSEFSQFGSLLDINNRLRQATTKVMHESLVMHFTSQILNIVHHLHSCKIIHADIKPDNFLLMKVPNADSHVPTLRLIDFGCAIDMTLFQPGTQFKKVIQTDGFTCTEMQEGRPWSYQTDLFCIAGTVHVMLFGEYMQLIKKFGEWDIKQKMPRYLKKNAWTNFFSKLLNIKDVENLPNLLELKSSIDAELYNMESELQKHVRTLSNLLHKR